MTSSGSLKLLDFGIAKYGSSEVQTRHHTVKGKPAYLAPEIIEGEPFDARADLFSLGVVLHEILTLVPLFAAENDLLTLRKVLTMTIAPPSATRAEVPPALDAIVTKALARDPLSRYASAAEMARDLDEFVVSAHLHNDVVIKFVREAEALIALPRPSGGRGWARRWPPCRPSRRPSRPSAIWCSGSGCRRSGACCSAATTARSTPRPRRSDRVGWRSAAAGTDRSCLPSPRSDGNG